MMWGILLQLVLKTQPFFVTLNLVFSNFYNLEFHISGELPNFWSFTSLPGAKLGYLGAWIPGSNFLQSNVKRIVVIISQYNLLLWLYTKTRYYMLLYIYIPPINKQLDKPLRFSPKKTLGRRLLPPSLPGRHDEALVLLAAKAWLSNLKKNSATSIAMG